MPTLVEEYRDGAKDLRAAVAGMTREQLLAKPVAGKMSTLEVVCHIADFEPVYADRIKRVLSHENATLLGADENLFLKALKYQEREVAEELAVVEATRAALSRLLGLLSPEQWTRAGTHSERGVLSVEALVKSQVVHIAHHLMFIREKRQALGI